MSRNNKKKFEEAVAPAVEETPVEEVEVDMAEPTAEKTPTKEPSKKMVEVTCDRLNVRAYPGIDADIKCIMNSGDKLEVTDDRRSDWLGVKVDDVNGFVMSKFVKEV